MKNIIIALASLFIVSSAFSYDVSCDASRYLGIKKFKLTISNINTSFDERSGYVVLKNSSEEVVIESDVFVIADYMEGDSLLTIETKNLDIHGYINMNSQEGDFEIKNKSYSVSNCEYIK